MIATLLIVCQQWQAANAGLLGHTTLACIALAASLQTNLLRMIHQVFT